MTASLGRRDFLKASIASVVAGAAVLTATPTVTVQAQRATKRYAMLVDPGKCIGCQACVVACASENNIPLGSFRTWVEVVESEDGVPVFVPKQCNHCDNPTCVPVCPTGATYRRDDGIVAVRDELCIACGRCIEACPYAAPRFINPVKGVVDKCDFCTHRIEAGRLPACVEACPYGAKVFGDINDPGSEISDLMRRVRTVTIRPDYGTKPMVVYVELPEKANR